MNPNLVKIIFLGLSLLLVTGCPRPVTNNDTYVYNTAEDDGAQSQASPPAHGDGGTINGGGGKGVRCTKNGRTTLEVLDLYEARSIYHLKVLDFGNDSGKARTALANIFAKHTHTPGHIEYQRYVKAIEKYLFTEFIDSKIHFVEAPQRLKPVADAYEPLLEEGCETVQIALFYDESSLLIDRSLWNQLDVTNRTALLAHELIYSVARRSGITNSVSSRKLVGRLLSEQGVVPLLHGIPTSDFPKAFSCSIQTDRIRMGEFYMFPKESIGGQSVLQVAFNLNSVINPHLFKTSVVIDGVDLRQLVSQRPYEFMFAGNLEVDGYSNLGGDVSFQFLGTDDDHRSTLRGFIVAVPPGKGGVPERMAFKCQVPDNLVQILPSVGIREGEYKSKKLIRGVYQDSVKINSIGSFRIIHDGESLNAQGQKEYCRWTETGLLKGSGDNLTYFLESVELSSGDEVNSPCGKDVRYFQASLAKNKSAVYAFDFKNYEPVSK